MTNQTTRQIQKRRQEHRPARLEQLLANFPGAVRPLLRTLPQTGGRLEGKHCHHIMAAMGIEIEALMLALLPMAGLFAVAPISRFDVGAVGLVTAEAGAAFADFPTDPPTPTTQKTPTTHTDPQSLFLGANLEFPGQAMVQTIHAEQAVVAAAWHHGAGTLSTLAVSDPPCGFCRQFLNELDTGGALKIITPETVGGRFLSTRLGDLLPASFGPRDLNVTAGLMAPAAASLSLVLETTGRDDVVQQALTAARTSYAPYSGNFAGCAVVLGDGRIFVGRHAETAAFNPAIAPLQAALVGINQSYLDGIPPVSRVVLVETPTICHQEALTRMLLKTYAPEVRLEYYRARPVPTDQTI